MKRTLSVIFAMLLLSSVVGCGGGDTGGTAAENTAVNTNEATTEAVSTRTPLNLPATDFKGAELRILEYEYNKFVYYYDFAWSEDKAGQLINDAIMTRNMAIEDRYNCKIKVTNHTDPVTVAKTDIPAGSDEYDVMELYINNAMTLGQESYFYNFYDIPHISMDAEWWDQIIQRDIALNNKIYCMTGDISIYDEELNYCIYFNKDVVKDNNVSDPYEEVRNNNWTWDTMMTGARIVSKDLNGDGVRDEKDSYGVLTDKSMFWLYYYTSGQRITELDEKGEPHFTVASQRVSDVCEGLVKYLTESDTILWSSRCTNGWTTLNEVLKENRALYRPGSIYDMQKYREMEADFGVLPYPKYDNAQEDYCHPIATPYCAALCVPVTNRTNLDRTGFLLEALAYESKDTVTNAYYDVNLYTKLSRDNDSGEMLDIIFATRTYDVGKVYNWGGIEAVFSNMCTSNTSIATSWASIAEAAQTAMEKTMAIYREVK